jgi:hypothetical protein
LLRQKYGFFAAVLSWRVVKPRFSVEQNSCSVFSIGTQG